MIRKMGWETDFFNRNIYNIDENDNTALLDLNEVVKEKKIHIIQCCCDISNTDFINRLEENGFSFIDLRVIYETDIHLLKSMSTTRRAFANESDIPALKRISGPIFNYSRFYHPAFDKQLVDKYHQVWIEKAVKGEFDDFCIINRHKSVNGFISGKFEKTDAVIGLIGVDEGYQSSGIGLKLVQQFIEFSKENNIKKITVSTQGRNIIARNLYIKAGFSLIETKAWYYRFS